METGLESKTRKSLNFSRLLESHTPQKDENATRRNGWNSGENSGLNRDSSNWWSLAWRSEIEYFLWYSVHREAQNKSLWNEVTEKRRKNPSLHHSPTPRRAPHEYLASRARPLSLTHPHSPVVSQSPVNIYNEKSAVKESAIHRPLRTRCRNRLPRPFLGRSQIIKDDWERLSLSPPLGTKNSIKKNNKCAVDDGKRQKAGDMSRSHDRGHPSSRCPSHLFTLFPASLRQNRELKHRQRRRKREQQKSNRFFWQITTLHVHHAFLYIS